MTFLQLFLKKKENEIARLLLLNAAALCYDARMLNVARSTLFALCAASASTCYGNMAL
eukprot:CAMPEP_0174718274 /NCGR_PEP_ID=MMETSP1094-20130205/28442_1 /TAXON_ID=156173 /ORGANISM="Chrysochromulina brevifilum, Strain UTEX LB 985" /LENGTH=57 /DNA_ID=CAMNT_0015918335 /DNA_START=118 /DNA_END=288 /DNA_ORIENTATION=-